MKNTLGHRLINRIQILADASLTRARKFASCFQNRVATALKCLSLLKNRSTRFLFRYSRLLNFWMFIYLRRVTPIARPSNPAETARPVPLHPPDHAALSRPACSISVKPAATVARPCEAGSSFLYGRTSLLPC